MSATLDALDAYRRPVAVVEPVATPAATVAKAPKKAKVGNAPRPSAVVAVVEPVAVATIESDDTDLGLELSALGNGGRDGTGKRIKATVLSGEDSGHKVRIIAYTDTAAEMALALSMLGIEPTVNA